MKYIGQKDVTIISATQVTINHYDGSSVDILLNGNSLEVGGNKVTASDIPITALTLTKIGESLHMNFTMQAGSSVIRTFTGQTTLTPRK